MNKAFLIGNLTRDPDLRTTPSTGTSICNFTIAVARKFKNPQTGERETDFIPVVVWRQQADNCGKYLRKGSQVAVSGSIQTRTYEANDGSRRHVTEIVADEIKFLTPKQERQREPGEMTADDRYESSQSIMHEIDDDLPF